MATPGNKPKLLGSQDLLTYYNLLPIYDKYVKPYPPPDRSAHLDQTLQPYVADLPGRNDVEPDGFLMNILRDPQISDRGPPITPLERDVLKEAYALKPGPIPGFDASILGTDDGSGATGGERGTVDSAAEGLAIPAVEGEMSSSEKKHKKKKKKRKHSHEHEEDGHSHGEHKKKKKKKREEYHE
ncbi:hypothetical protein VTP01DRAFT_10469 [Rhizomucor pusillus]|uniref:uncharacterized protein n=1 Tax=Rhizomucor pusillus TaxID=4840 RepID=UPI003742CC1C